VLNQVSLNNKSTKNFVFIFDQFKDPEACDSPFFAPEPFVPYERSDTSSSDSPIDYQARRSAAICFGRYHSHAAQPPPTYEQVMMKCNSAPK
jgi:hypothetical protein